MTSSQAFLYFCLSFTGGVFLNSIIPIPKFFILGFLILGLILISVFWKYKKIVLVGFCFLGLLTGIWREQSAELKITNNELRKFNYLGQKISLIGTVSAEPDIREKSQKLTIKIREIYDQHEKHSRAVKGRILVTINCYPEYKYGDKLKITGKLLTPKEFEGGKEDNFNYKDYLAKNGIFATMYWPKIRLLKRGNYQSLTSVIYAKILQLKSKLRGSIYQNLPPPQSSILGAMILGDKRKISKEWKEKLNRAGVRHITAVSGMHITILTSILMALLVGLGLWRKQAFYFTLIFIALFIVMIGFQPSAIRAGIMGGFFLLAQYFGRESVSSRAIIVVGAIMLAQNPLLLRSDVGFQLSFLAVMGIIYLGPIFRNWLKFLPGKDILNLRNVISMTLSAQIFTLPILVYNFGYVSAIAPITNILVVPLLPFVMLFGFIFAFTGIFFSPIGWVLSWFSWLLLTYLVKLIDFFSKIPPAYFNISWHYFLAFYLVFGVLVWKLNQEQKLRFLEY